MSSRRFGNRYTAANASEAHQRQLTAPVHKWRKAWVAPTGLQPESSYKICKWVRVESTAEDTPAPEDEDDDMEDGEEGAEEGDDANDGEAGEEAEGEAGGAGAGAGSDPTPKAPAAMPEAGERGAAGTVSTAEDGSAGASALTVDADATVTGEVDPTHGVPAEIPANAIEMTNTAPGHVEDGTGDLGTAGGVEFVQGESHNEDVPMDEPSAADESVDANANAAQAQGTEGTVNKEEADPEQGEAPTADSGLTMGEMQPVEVPEMQMPAKEEDQAMEAE